MYWLSQTPGKVINGATLLGKNKRGQCQEIKVDQERFDSWKGRSTEAQRLKFGLRG
jgi:hypothetical protein